MDLVNSVTQNSNNRQATMENRPANYSTFDLATMRDDGGGPGFSPSDAQWNNGTTIVRPQAMHLQAASCGTQETSVKNTSQANSSNNLSNDGAGSNNNNNRGENKSSAGPKTQVPDYLKAIGMDPRKFWPKKYRFTREKSPGQHNPLTIAQRNFYETNGYIIIDDCCSQRLLSAIRSQHQESALINEFLLDKLVAKNGKLLQFVKCFCDERVMLMTNRFVETFQTNDSVKSMIDNESSHRQHLFRDWLYLPFRPIDKVVCTITAIEPLEHVILVVPGTHRVGQCSISSTLQSISAAYDSSQERSNQAMARELYECSPEKLSSLVEKSKKGFKYINLKPGQTLFYHPGLVHGFSDDLVNFRKRQLASIAYYAAADCEYVDLRESASQFINNSQPSKESETAAAAASGSPKSKLILPITLAHFEDLNPCDYKSWMNKPRLLHDSRSNL